MTHPILILTTEPLPVADLPATGAGLRAWGLAQGLRAAGLPVRLLMPAEAASSFRPMGSPTQPHGEANLGQANDWPDWVGTFPRQHLRSVVRDVNPVAIVLQHWGLAAELGEVDCPLAIDLAGPHLLERRLWGSPDPERDLREKLDALRRADFLCCSGRLQRLYFLPYLSLSGWDIVAPDALPVIPFSMRPAEPAAPARADRLIYGGFFLPWQDPADSLAVALEVLDELGHGELLFIGGAHPTLDVSRGRFEPLLARLQNHPRVRLLPPMSFAEYAALLCEGGIALDLMARNAERELAFTTRTVAYLAAGLPVIHNNYSELGELIAARGAGWTLDPDDPQALRQLLRGLLGGAIDPAPAAAAARRLVAHELNWAETIGPLADWCRAPRPRPHGLARRLAFEEQGRRLAEVEQQLLNTEAALATLRGKRWVRWGLGLTNHARWLRWPAALLTALLAPLLLAIFLASDLLGTAPPADQPPPAPSGEAPPH